MAIFKAPRQAIERRWWRNALARLVAAAPAPPAAAPNMALIGEAGWREAEWIARLHPGDALAPRARDLIQSALAANPDAQMLYADEALANAPADAPREERYLMKPGFDPVLLEGLDYVSRFVLFRRDRLAALGLDAGEDFAPASVLKAYAQGLAPAEILHLPHPALIRAAPPPAPARQRPAAPKRPEKISIVIPNRNSPDLIRTALDGALTGTDYPDLEVIVVDNGSDDAETLALYRSLEADPRFRVDIRPGPFNFSAMVNRGIAMATGAHVLLLNNDIEVEAPGWLAEMAACLETSVAGPGVGIVGAKLLFPDRRLQHAGVVLGHQGRAGHWFYKAPEDAPGPMGTLSVRRSVSVVTGAAMLISGACMRDVGAWDEENFRVAFNDVDYCARARAKGWGVVYTPHAALIHHESVSRRKDKAARALFQSELAALRRAHGTETYEDPAQSPWWSRKRSQPRLTTRAALPKARAFMGGSRGEDAD